MPRELEEQFSVFASVIAQVIDAEVQWTPEQVIEVHSRPLSDVGLCPYRMIGLRIVKERQSFAANPHCVAMHQNARRG